MDLASEIASADPAASRISKTESDMAEERAADGHHPCPVCGKTVFECESSYEICPVCGWEDDALMEANPGEYGGTANDLSLALYKERYEALNASIPEYRAETDGLCDQKPFDTSKLSVDADALAAAKKVLHARKLDERAVISAVLKKIASLSATKK